MKSIIFTLAVLSITGILFADKITLNDGRIVDGRIVKKNAGKVTIVMSTGGLTYEIEQDKIKNVEVLKDELLDLWVQKYDLDNSETTDTAAKAKMYSNLAKQFIEAKRPDVATRLYEIVIRLDETDTEAEAFLNAQCLKIRPSHPEKTPKEKCINVSPLLALFNDYQKIDKKNPIQQENFLKKVDPLHGERIEIPWALVVSMSTTMTTAVGENVARKQVVTLGAVAGGETRSVTRLKEMFRNGYMVIETDQNLQKIRTKKTLRGMESHHIHAELDRITENSDFIYYKVAFRLTEDDKQKVEKWRLPCAIAVKGTMSKIMLNQVKKGGFCTILIQDCEFTEK